MKHENIPEIDHLAGLVGEFIQYWGFKQIHGRVWLHVYLSDTPLDAKALMARTKVSKALISITVRDLLEHDVLKQGPDTIEGTTTYISNPEIAKVIQRILRSREKVMMGKIQAAYQQVKTLNQGELSGAQISSKQIKNLEGLLSKGSKLLNAAIKII